MLIVTVNEFSKEVRIGSVCTNQMSLLSIFARKRIGTEEPLDNLKSRNDEGQGTVLESVNYYDEKYMMKHTFIITMLQIFRLEAFSDLFAIPEKNNVITRIYRASSHTPQPFPENISSHSWLRKCSRLVSLRLICRLTMLFMWWLSEIVVHSGEKPEEAIYLFFKFSTGLNTLLEKSHDLQ